MMIQFITGHCWLKRHLLIVNKEGNGECRLCGSSGTSYDDTETPIHLATNCPSLAEAMIGALRQVNPGIPFNDNVDKVTFQAHWDLQWLDLILRDESMSSLWGFMGRTTSPDLPQGTSATLAETRGAD